MLLLAAMTLAAVVLVVVVRQHQTRHSSQAARASSLAPDFTLMELDGSTLRLSDYRGKVVLLNFWASWCAPCREEIPSFVKWQGKYGNQGLRVIGVSMDDALQPVLKFNREFRMNYPVAVGNQELASRYGGILGLPVNIVIGRDGKIVSKHLGMAELSELERELTAQLAHDEKQ